MISAARNMRLQEKSFESFASSLVDSPFNEEEAVFKHESMSLASQVHNPNQSQLYWHQDDMSESTAGSPYSYKSYGGSSPSSTHIVLSSIVQDERALEKGIEIGRDKIGAIQMESREMQMGFGVHDFAKEIEKDIEKEIGGICDVSTKSEGGDYVKDLLKNLGEIGKMKIDMKGEGHCINTTRFRDDTKVKFVDSEFSNVPYVMYRNQHNMRIADHNSMWSCGDNMVTDWSAPGYDQSTATPLYVDNNPGRHDESLSDPYRFSWKGIDLEYLLSSSDVARQAFIEMLRNLKSTVDPKSLSSAQLSELLWYYLMNKSAKEKREREAILYNRFDKTLRGVEHLICDSLNCAECSPTQYGEAMGGQTKEYDTCRLLQRNTEPIMPASSTDFSNKQEVISCLYDEQYARGTLIDPYVSQQIQKLSEDRCRNSSYCPSRHVEHDSSGYIINQYGRFNILSRESEHQEGILFEQYRKNLDGLFSRSDPTEFPPDIIQNLNQHKKIYTDDRDRMVYVSWIPKKGRAFNAADKRKMELDLKQKLRGMGLTGLTKVLLFPPKGVHCKLIFESRLSAAEFMSKYGGENSSAETECWKADMCRLYDIDMHEKFDKTVVKIEWSQK